MTFPLGKNCLSEEAKAKRLLQRFKVDQDLPIYALGTFDERVTVLDQQTRALNLAWGLIESGEVNCVSGPVRRIAIIGTGFAGLTLAAALLQKEALLQVTLLEEQDTLLPLQQGSDSRWLHPRIYEWPKEGSAAGVAMLPVMNWSAARASDVVVQVLSAWSEVVREAELPDEPEDGKRGLQLFCNTRHLQIAAPKGGKVRVECVGERRSSGDGAGYESSDATRGCSETFDLVVLAVGFGIESDRSRSYWRNEMLGQPSLTGSRQTYVVSGQGDGAFIDLLRLRVSQFRQDRILDELFQGRDRLLDQLREFKEKLDNRSSPAPLFEWFEEIWGTPDNDATDVLNGLRRRLRRDTEVILQIRARHISDLLKERCHRVSFQNALLVYLLYKCGGFSPSCDSDEILADRYDLTDEKILRRHGVKPLNQLTRLLPEDVAQTLARGEPWRNLRQAARPGWPGGWFGFPGTSTEAQNVTDEKRRFWRKEYLPGPTALITTALCGSVVGLIEQMRPNRQFRVTLHRALVLHDTDLLQQTCEYQGYKSPGTGEESSIGRTFDARDATIGLAYSTRSIVRSRKEVTPDRLREVMDELRVKRAASSMNKDVTFVMGIPILQPEDGFRANSPVAGILFIDSQAKDFWLENKEVLQICSVLETGVRSLNHGTSRKYPGVWNFALGPVRRDAGAAGTIPSKVLDALEVVSRANAPSVKEPFQFNFEHTDLTSLRRA